MPGTRFTVLTGHLSQYPLADLIGILRHQRKTGRLLIEYIGAPAILFFKNGDLVDAEYNSLVGVQAIFVAFVQPHAAFNFNPLIQPSRYSIDLEQQRVILELLGCWTEDAIVVKSSVVNDDLIWDDMETAELPPAPALLAIPTDLDEQPAALGAPERMLALPAAPRASRPAWVLPAALLAVLLIFGVPTLIAINSKARSLPVENVVSQPNSTNTQATAPGSSVNGTSQTSQNSEAQIPSTSANTVRERNERPQATDQTQTKEALKETAIVLPPAKETVQPDVKKVEAVKTTPEASSGQTVKVVMRIENGRVVQATVGDRRAGAEAYESMALRIARQRRYPAGVNKQETLIMKVDAPKQ